MCDNKGTLLTVVPRTPLAVDATDSEKLPRSPTRLRLARPLVLLACSLAGASCGDHPAVPSGPTSTAVPPTNFAVVDALSGRPVSGAVLTSAPLATTCTTSAAGGCSFPVSLSTPVTIRADGYLERRITPPGTQGFYGAFTVNVWPAATPEGMSPAVTREIVYTSWAQCCGGGGLADKPLRRILLPTGGIGFDPAPIRIGLSDRLREDPRAVAAMRSAVDGIARLMLGTRVQYSISPQTIRVGAGSADPARVAFEYAYNGGQVSGVGILYPNEERLLLAAESPRGVDSLMHMVGHAIGLGHTSLGGTVMGPGMSAGGGFSAVEEQYWRLLRSRQSGNRYPDDETLVSTAPGEPFAYCDRVPR